MWEWRRFAVSAIIAEVVGVRRMVSEESDMLAVKSFLH